MNPIAGPQPIQDIAQPGDSLGNPENLANIPIHAAPGNASDAPINPIAGGSLARPAPAPSHPEAKKEDLDKVLKDVNKDVKAATAKPKKLSKPVIEISAAIVVALGLSAAAYFAFKS